MAVTVSTTRMVTVTMPETTAREVVQLIHYAESQPNGAPPLPTVGVASVAAQIRTALGGYGPGGLVQRGRRAAEPPPTAYVLSGSDETEPGAPGTARPSVSRTPRHALDRSPGARSLAAFTADR